MVAPARRAALGILEAVEKGRFAADLLRAQGASLSEADAALATELVLGCLRRRPQLDFLVEFYSGREVRDLDPEIRLILHLGVYQIRFLDRIPSYAVVNDSVELARVVRKASAAGLVNAVLRRVDRKHVAWPKRAVELSLPEWLLAKWEADFGVVRTHRIAQSLLVPPETYVRVPPARKPSDAALMLEPTGLEGCYRLLGADPGPYRIQDISSQAIVPLLELRAGDRFLDLCAAPGNKTAQALETPVRAVAADISARRLAALAGLACHRVVLDGTKPLPFSHRFDRILIDAPCSGTGTIRRNPELKWRVTPEDLRLHQARQIRLVLNALEWLEPEGRLVYSTCSLEVEENEAVVEAVRQARSLTVTVEEQLRRWPGEQPGDGFFAAVLTSKKSVSS